MKLVETITDSKTYTETTNGITSGCISILFTNKGDNTAIVNGKRLAQNESWAVSQPYGYIDNTRYSLQFDSDGTTSQLEVDRIVPSNYNIPTIK